MFSNLLRQQARLALSSRVSSLLSRQSPRYVMGTTHRLFSISRAQSQDSSPFSQTNGQPLDSTSEAPIYNSENHSENRPEGARNTQKKRVVHVGNVPWTCDEQDVKDTFAEYGGIRRIIIIRDKEGQSLGRGYIEFAEDKDAERVVQSGLEEPFVMQERVLRVETAGVFPHEWRTDSKGPGTPNPTLHISNYPIPGDKASVLALLHNFTRNISRIHFMRDREGNDTGKLFVTFKDIQSAEKALDTFFDHEMEGVRLHVRYALDKRSPRPARSSRITFHT
ncbi:hypothetical protein NP233_g5254 [Leucocoprinus birnbaumii]|uniref:RRM domain-containing protein n=1 Tax=Leucocoprinus birnbaumii TaxID=56174 RepID=A0AAD5YR41_9AGAR|nr:hypothetical protein NP233_g5254 [Leucocoprinus birnbaumii]